MTKCLLLGMWKIEYQLKLLFHYIKTIEFLSLNHKQMKPAFFAHQWYILDQLKYHPTAFHADFVLA